MNRLTNIILTGCLSVMGAFGQTKTGTTIGQFLLIGHQVKVQLQFRVGFLEALGV